MRSIQLRGQVSRRLNTQQPVKLWDIHNTNILHPKHNEIFDWAKVRRGEY
jgi:hypothetical protein